MYKFRGYIHSFTNLKIRHPNLRFIYFLEMVFRFEIRGSVDDHRFESRFEIRSLRMEVRVGHKIRYENYFCLESDSANLKSTNLEIRKRFSYSLTYSKNRKSLG